MLDVGRESHGDPQVVLLWETEIADGNTDDGVGLSIKNESSAKDSRIGSETRAPERIRENSDKIVSRLLIRKVEKPPLLCGCAQFLEKTIGNDRDAELRRGVLAGQRFVGLRVDRRFFE